MWNRSCIIIHKIHSWTKSSFFKWNKKISGRISCKKWA